MFVNPYDHYRLLLWDPVSYFMCHCWRLLFATRFSFTCSRLDGGVWSGADGWFSVCKSVSVARWNVIFTLYEVEEAMTGREGKRSGRALWVTGVSSVFILANQQIFCRNCKCESSGRTIRSRSGHVPVLSGWIWRDCSLCFICYRWCLWNLYDFYVIIISFSFSGSLSCFSYLCLLSVINEEI